MVELEAAKAHSRRDDHTRAIESVERAIRIDATLEEAHLLLVSLYAMTGDETGRTSAIDRGLSVLPRSPRLFHARGMHALEREAILDAVVALEMAVELSGEAADAEMMSDLAYAYLFVAGGTKLKDAESLARRARARDPRSFSACFTLAEALLRLGQLRDAVSFYREALRLKPDDPTSERRLAFALQKIGGGAESNSTTVNASEAVQGEQKK